MSKSLFRYPDRLLDLKRIEKTRLSVMVVPLCYGAGASYACSQMLKNGLLGQKTPDGLRTLVEIGKPYFYLALGMEKRFAGKNFYFYTDGGECELNIDMGINWYLKHPGDDTAEVLCAMKMLALAPGNLVLFDASRADHDLVLNMISDVDLTYIVIDPSPAKLLEGEEYLDQLREKSKNSILLVNKFCDGIHRGQLRSFLGTQDYCTLQAENLSKIIKAEYNCSLP